MGITAIIFKICLTAMTNNQSCPEMLALAELESSFNKQAIGSVGEVGLFQIRPEYFGKVPKTTVAQTAQAVKVVKWIKKVCQKDLTMNWVLCYNIGTTKGKTMLRSKPGPYRLKYLKLAKKWKTWYEKEETRSVLFTQLLNRYRTENMVKAQNLVQTKP